MARTSEYFLLLQVVVNSQRGGWLGKPLSLYLAVAKQVTFYGRTLLVRSPYEEACTELAQQLADSPTEQLDLEFDVISIIRFFLAWSLLQSIASSFFRIHRIRNTLAKAGSFCRLNVLKNLSNTTLCTFCGNCVQPCKDPNLASQR